MLKIQEGKISHENVKRPDLYSIAQICLQEKSALDVIVNDDRQFLVVCYQI